MTSSRSNHTVDMMQPTIGIWAVAFEPITRVLILTNKVDLTEQLVWYGAEDVFICSSADEAMKMADIYYASFDPPFELDEEYLIDEYVELKYDVPVGTEIDEFGRDIYTGEKYDGYVWIASIKEESGKTISQPERLSKRRSLNDQLIECKITKAYLCKSKDDAEQLAAAWNRSK